MTQEFEESIPSVTKADTRHHEQVPGVQVLFKKDVASLVSSFEEVGNPFEENSKDLFALDLKVIVENEVIQAVKNVITIGQEQYNTFVEERFEKRTKEVTSVISKNKLPLLKNPLEQKSDKKKVEVAALKDDCALFSRLYIACQSREGKLQEFFNPLLTKFVRSRWLDIGLAPISSHLAKKHQILRCDWLPERTDSAILPVRDYSLFPQAGTSITCSMLGQEEYCPRSFFWVCVYGSIRRTYTLLATTFRSVKIAEKELA